MLDGSSPHPMMDEALLQPTSHGTSSPARHSAAQAWALFHEQAGPISPRKARLDHTLRAVKSRPRQTERGLEDDSTPL